MWEVEPVGIIQGATIPQWVLSGASIDMDFADGLYYGGVPSTLLSVSRASTGYVQNVDSSYSLIGANLPRIGTSKGLLVEEARTNSVTDNSMQGAVVGSVVTPQTISSITRVTTTATLTTSTNHNLSTGDLITVSGATPSQYNGSFNVTSTGATTLTYQMVSDPGASASPVGTYTAFSKGTLPTGWADYATVQSGWVKAVVVGLGTESGIDYIDLRFAGTLGPSFPTGSFGMYHQQTLFAATVGQTYNCSMFMKLIAGSLATIPGHLTFSSDEFTAAPAYLTTDTVGVSDPPSSGVLGSCRLSGAYTLVNASVTQINSYFGWFGTGSNSTQDITIRLGWPQCELGGFATSPIRTTNATVTRAADSINASGALFANMKSAMLSTVIALSALEDAGANFNYFFDTEWPGGSGQVRTNGATDVVAIAFVIGSQNIDITPGGIYTANSKIGWSINSAFSNTLVANNGTPGTGTVTWNQPAATEVRIGRGPNYLNGYMRRFTVWQSKLADATLKAFTA